MAVSNSHWPVPARRGSGIIHAASPWDWADVATAHAEPTRGGDVPAMLYAREAVDWLTHYEMHEAMASPGHRVVWWSEDEPVPWYGDQNVPELYGFLVVVGVLEANPGWASMRDDSLASAAIAWFFGHEQDWPWWAGSVMGQASHAPAGSRSGWTPWWRAASIWAQREELALAAVACEHLVRRFRESEGPTALAAAAPWLPAPGHSVPTWRTVDALDDVVGSARDRWPWPYDTWPIGERGGRDLEPDPLRLGDD